jgi:hypothetical protein
MEQWKKNRTRATWSLAWLFALLFHQLLPILFGISFNSQTFIVITIYFGIITFFFTWMFLFLPTWLIAIILFIFGAFMELAIFGVIPNFWLAGLFYVAMLFVARWLSTRMAAPPTEAD